MNDSQSFIHLSKNSTYHERTKRIDVRLRFVRGNVEKGKVKVMKVSTNHNVADMIHQVIVKLQILPLYAVDKTI